MSKLDILATIRMNLPEVISLPDEDLYAEYTENEIPDENESNRLLIAFKQSLKQVGAITTDEMPPDRMIDFGRPENWNDYPENCSLEKLYALDTIVLNGQFGVAENGAIWLDEDDFPNRLLPFVSQNLIIRVSSKQIVGTMHEAYRKIASQNTGFGVFISGPSKTADIEQSLVYGAHGAKTLVVVISDLGIT